MHRLIAVSILALALAAPAGAETRALSGFTGISAMNGVDVEVTQSERFTVIVEGPDANRIATRIDRGALRISRTNAITLGTTPPLDARVRVTMPAVTSLAVARGAQVRVANIRAETLSIAASQGGDLEVSGVCQTLSASASMGGNIQAAGLDCASVSASASMGGNIDVHATQSLSASASMGGNIDVSGNPATRHVRASMGGNID